MNLLPQWLAALGLSFLWALLIALLFWWTWKTGLKVIGFLFSKKIDRSKVDFLEKQKRWNEAAKKQ